MENAVEKQPYRIVLEEPIAESDAQWREIEIAFNKKFGVGQIGLPEDVKIPLFADLRLFFETIKNFPVIHGNRVGHINAYDAGIMTGVLLAVLSKVENISSLANAPLQKRWRNWNYAIELAHSHIHHDYKKSSLERFYEGFGKKVNEYNVPLARVVDELPNMVGRREILKLVQKDRVYDGLVFPSGGIRYVDIHDPPILPYLLKPGQQVVKVKRTDTDNALPKVAIKRRKKKKQR